jgi:CO/xanthine dehydrogenase FAD-binding subunit
MPVTQIERYHRPGDLESAWRLIRDGGAAVRLLAGGTDLVVSCPPGVRELVDLQAVGLPDIEVASDGTLRLGAMVTFTELLEQPAVAAHAGGVLSEMLTQVGSVLHRNGATIGGHIARGRMSDVIPVLVALDATVLRYDGAHDEVPIAEYHEQPRHPHVITGVVLPALPDRSAAAFTRFSRSAYDHAILNGCCRVDLTPGAAAEVAEVVAARVVIGETAVLGRRVVEAEELLVGRPLTPEAIASAAEVVREIVDLHGDWVASARYRRHLAGVAVTRCLDTVVQRCQPKDGAR